MSSEHPELFPDLAAGARREQDPLHRALARFEEMGSRTLVRRTMAHGRSLPTYVNEYWTARQRAAHSLHEVSYRACFKPQLPAFFIERLTRPGDLVYDPFLGRGTTMIEAALRGRVPLGCDINPLSRVLCLPRLHPPLLEDVAARLLEIDFSYAGELDEDLLVFFHPETLREICGLREYLRGRRDAESEDHLDRWIEMVAVNRLTGHSKGFFSVYTMPPNQAVGVEAQRKINERRAQQPERRNVPELILRKTKSLLRDLEPAQRQQLMELGAHPAAGVHVAAAERTPTIASASVQLVVTSPPFLDVVQYRADNWLRCWFCGIDPDEVPVTIHGKVADWAQAMQRVFVELRRVLAPGGAVAFEVGEVRGGKIRLDEEVVPPAVAAGLTPELLLIHEQEFTKTANCWGISNNERGTNSNRVVLLRKDC